MPLRTIEGWLDRHNTRITAVLYLVLVPAAILMLALLASHNLSANRRQDREQAAAIRENRKLILGLETVRQGLCALRDERQGSADALVKQIKQEQEFLNTRAHQLPSLGLTIVSLEADIKAQQLNLNLQRGTLRALRNVRCK